MRTIIKVSGIVLTALMTLLISAAWHFSTVLMHPGPYTCPVDIYIYCGTPDEIGLPYEEIQFHTEDGVLIKGWYIERTPGAPAVLFVPGRGVDRHEALRYAPSMFDSGFNLLLIDLRNTGASDGSITTMGFYEQLDVRAAVDYLVNERAVSSVGVFAFSMGASTSILAMAEDSRISAAVLDSPYSDMRKIVVERGKQEYHLPEYPLLPIVFKFYEWRTGADPEKTSPIQVIDTIGPRPIFLVHGTADTSVGVHHSDALYVRAAEPRRYWRIPDGKHTSAWNHDRVKAEREFPAFFRRYLK
ncbi:MAG: alpha/beta fold hydrolase [Leptospiraceae bacterium]|nr:alpha/beta fold hydrolase [Leptospiraceae bacterium]MCB1317767.1 alpha/beta fold hydrolase [Leptospiraceae bacterium]